MVKELVPKGREMADSGERFPIWRITEEICSDNTVDVVVAEFPLTITLNNREVATLLCSPGGLEYLAVGYLFSEGLISGKEDVREIVVDDEKGTVDVRTKKDTRPVSSPSYRRLITSAGGSGASFSPNVLAKVESNIKISARELFVLVEGFIQRSEVFKATGGVHSAALCDTKSILVFNEDIGRHNAIDKVFGECLLNNIPTAGRLVITSGRVSSEILLKVARRDIPILISESAPTSMGVRLANDQGITLIGFARGRKANIYSNEWRVVAE